MIAGLLRGHVYQSAYFLIMLLRPQSSMRCTQSKVYYLHSIATFSSEQYVFRLQIPVHVVFLVDIVHALQHGQHHLAHFSLGQGWRLPEQALQLPSFDVFHLYHDEIRSFKDLPELDDAGVVQGLQDGGLVLQDIYGLCAEGRLVYDLQS